MTAVSQTLEQLAEELARAHRLIDELIRPATEHSRINDTDEARSPSDEELKKYCDSLEEMVRARTAELIQANERLRIEILERNQAQEALWENSEKFRIHFSLANDVMFSYDNQLRVLSVTPNVERVLGYRPEELVGKTFQEANVLHPDSLAQAFKNAIHVLSGNPIYSSIYRFIRKDGQVRYGEVSGVPCMRNGFVYAVTTIARDVTERFEMAQAIQESEERYRVTLQSMPDAVSIIRIADLVYLYVNDAFCRITGYSPGETVGKTLLDLHLHASPEGLSRCEDLARNNVPLLDNMEHRSRRKDGTVMDTLISARPVHYNGEDCLVMVMTDITVLKQLEAERKRLEIQSHKMESIGTLASGIAHDFNNILTTIIGYTQMSMKDLMGLAKGANGVDMVHTDLDEVRKAALRARDLVNHILAFSRHAEKDHVPMDLASTVRGSLKALRPTLSSNIRVRENVRDSYTILGDPVQIHQVFSNLWTNASHAMEKAGGELEVSLQRVLVEDGTPNLDMAPGQYLRLRVRDTGPGMTEKVLARIFDPYFTTKWRGHGTGLGLSIAHGIVKSHGGSIVCRSAPGEGTTFDVYLPEHGFNAEAITAQTGDAAQTGDTSVLDLDKELSRPGVKKRQKKLPTQSTNKEH